MLYSVPYSNLDSQIATDLLTDGVGYSFALADSVWSVARIPVSYLLSKGEKTLKGLHLCTSATLYIDDIWYDNQEFIDQNRESGVLADFDEYEYLFQVSKNKIGDSPAIEMFTEGYPSAVEGNGVLKVNATSESANAVVDIKLFESVNVNDYKTVNFRIYYDGRVANSYAVKSKLVFMYNGSVDFYNDNTYYHHFLDSKVYNIDSLSIFLYGLFFQNPYFFIIH